MNCISFCVEKVSREGTELLLNYLLHEITHCRMILVLTFCCVDKLCISEMQSSTQTANSWGHYDVTSVDQHSSSNASAYTNSCCTTNAACASDSLQCCRRDCTDLHTDWQPLLLVIPMRLGLSDVNPIYFDAVKVRVCCCWYKLVMWMHIH